MSDPTSRTDDSSTVTSQPQRKKSWARRYLAMPTLIGVGLIVYIIFFSDNSASKRLQYQHVIDSISECLQQQQDSLQYYRELNRRLATDRELVEQVVREQYNMNRPNEDVYVIQ